jgi:long-chain acyl-CoA synthetase
MKNKLYEVKEYRDIREMINHSVAEFPNNVAFTIKTKAGKEPEYKDITYKEFKKDIDNFGAGLIKLGLSGKRVAVIGKNSYEWALTYYTVLSSVGTCVPLDKGLPEQEIEDLLIRSEADAVVFEDVYADIMEKIFNNK